MRGATPVICMQALYRILKLMLPMRGATWFPFLPYHYIILKFMLPMRGATMQARPFLPAPDSLNSCSPCGEQHGNALSLSLTSVTLNSCSPCGEQLPLQLTRRCLCSLNSCSPCGEQPGAEVLSEAMTILKFMLPMRGATSRPFQSLLRLLP